MRGWSRRGEFVGAVAKGRERGGCGHNCNAVNGGMGLVELHCRRSMPVITPRAIEAACS